MPVPKGSGQHAKPAFGQAAHIIRKFGGEAKLASLIGCSRITCFRWQYAPPAGTNGLIPNHQREAINKVARLEGVLLTADDWDQRRIHYKRDEQHVEDLGAMASLGEGKE